MNVRGGSTIFRVSRVPKNFSWFLYSLSYFKCILLFFLNVNIFILIVDICISSEGKLNN